MTFIDSRTGYANMLSNSADEYNDLIMESNDIIIYGETESPDCPPNGGFCHKYNKGGYIAAPATYGGKPLHITKASALPPHKIKSDASWGSKVVLNRLEFRDWNATTREGMRSQIFTVNKNSPDYVPMHEFYDTKFINVEADAMSYIFDPPQGWANPYECGEFPCTAP